MGSLSDFDMNSTSKKHIQRTHMLAATSQIRAYENILAGN